MYAYCLLLQYITHIFYGDSYNLVTGHTLTRRAL